MDRLPERTKKIRVLFVSHEGGLAGAERSLLDLIRGLNRDLFHTVVLVPKAGPLSGELERLGVCFLVGDVRWWFAKGRRRLSELVDIVVRMPRRVRAILKTIGQERIDLVYANTVACIDGPVAGRIAALPTIWHIREIVSRNADLRPYVPKGLVKYIVGLLADRIIAPSRSVGADMDCVLTRRKTRLVANGIDARRLLALDAVAAGRDLRARLGIDPGKLVVALVGHFVPIKGQLEFVQAADRVLRQSKNAVFLLVGSGNRTYRRQVIAEIERLGIGNHLRLMGYTDEIEAIMGGIDILTCASWVESFSRVVCEAMAAGKPVVATRCGGPEEIVVDGETGYLVPVRQPEPMAQKLLELLQDPDLRARMGAGGRQRVQRFFGMRQYVDGIETLLQELAISRGRLTANA
jgi:glycosyltransferase involved in cell wall biosynthesis